jgi:hypothetical protein
MNRLYSNYVPPKLTKLARGGYDTLDPVGSPEYVKQQQQYNSKKPAATVPTSEYIRRAVRPVVNNPVVKEVIDSKYDVPVAAMQAGTTASTLVPFAQPVSVPAAIGANAFGAVRGGLQMLNSWANGTYDSNKNPGANTQLATDTASNVIANIPGGRFFKNAPDILKPAYDTAVEMLKRPGALGTSVIGSDIANDQQPTKAQVAPQQPATAPQQPVTAPTASTTQATPQNIKTNSYRPKYSPPKLNKLAAKEEYLAQADYDPGFTIMQPGDNYRDFIRNNVKAQLEMGRRRGAFAGTILGALSGGLAGHNLLKDNDTLGKYSPYAAGAAGALLGAGIGNLAGRPLGMLSSVTDIPYTVLQSTPIMQEAYKKLTQPVFPDYVDPNTYI